MIREAVASTCKRFDDEYWSACDQDHRFPWEFYAAMAEGGWIGIAIPEEYGGGGRGHHRGVDPPRGGGRIRGVHERRQRHPHVDLRHEPGGDARERADEAEVPARRRRRVVCTSPSASPSPTPGTRHHRRSRRGPCATATTTSSTAEGLDLQGPGVPERVLLLTAPRRWPTARSRTDGMTLLLADLQRPGVDITPIAKMGRNAVASCEVGLRRTWPCPSRTGSGRRAGASRYLLDGLNAERILVASEALGIGKVALRRAVALRQRPGGVRPPDRPEPGHRLPPGRGPRQAARRRA